MRVDLPGCWDLTPVTMFHTLTPHRAPACLDISATTHAHTFDCLVVGTHATLPVRRSPLPVPPLPRVAAPAY